MSTPAKVYARALFEAAQEAGQTQKVAEDLRGLWSLCESSEGLNALIHNASLERSARDRVLKEILMTVGAHNLVFKIMYMLSARARLSIMGDLVKEFFLCVDADSGVLAGELQSAVELSIDELDGLSAAIAKRAGKKIRFEQKVDPNLLGGFVAKVGGKTYDSSLRTQLYRIRDELI